MRTDGHDEANSRFSQFCGSAYKEKFLILIPKAISIRAQIFKDVP